jgi:hypothetical protein
MMLEVPEDCDPEIAQCVARFTACSQCEAQREHTNKRFLTPSWADLSAPKEK